MKQMLLIFLSLPLIAHANINYQDLGNCFVHTRHGGLKSNARTQYPPPQSYFIGSKIIGGNRSIFFNTLMINEPTKAPGKVRLHVIQPPKNDSYWRARPVIGSQTFALGSSRLDTRCPDKNSPQYALPLGGFCKEFKEGDCSMSDIYFGFSVKKVGPPNETVGICPSTVAKRYEEAPTVPRSSPISGDERWKLAAEALNRRLQFLIDHWPEGNNWDQSPFFDELPSKYFDLALKVGGHCDKAFKDSPHKEIFQENITNLCLKFNPDNIRECGGTLPGGDRGTTTRG
ncbi:MAG: hypothetical protein AAF203_01615 [Pseudomonadota bacterium]